jgi:hypothetical protein
MALNICRFVQQVQPAGFVRIRPYGFLGNWRRQGKLELCVSVRDGSARRSVAFFFFRCRP